VRYHIHNSTPRAPDLTQINWVHAPVLSFKIHLNTILCWLSRSCKWSLSLMLHHQTLYVHLLFPVRAICPAYLILLDLTVLILIIIIFWHVTWCSQELAFWRNVLSPSSGWKVGVALSSEFLVSTRIHGASSTKTLFLNYPLPNRLYLRYFVQ